MLAGRRIMFAYGVGGNVFANVKPEVLPDGSWASQKQSLLDEIAAMIASDHDAMPNAGLPPTMHRLEVYGLDRTQLKGGTLGFYLLFDNAHHIATTYLPAESGAADPPLSNDRAVSQPAHAIPYNLHRLHRAKSLIACACRKGRTMKQFGLLSLSLLAFACALSAPTAVAQATPAQTTSTAAARLELIGADGQHGNISSADFHALPPKTVQVHNEHTGADETYQGVELSSLLARIDAPLGQKLRGKALAMYAEAR